MSYLVYRGDFQITTAVATTVIQVRGVGFQGKAVLFWWNGRDGTVDASGEVSYRAGFGFSKSTTERRCALFSSLHGSANGEGDGYGTTNACIGAILPGTSDPSTLEGLADFDAWNADGFDIKIDDQFATVFRVHYLVLGGTDLTDVAVGSFTGNLSLGTQDITSVGFQPDCLMCIGWSHTTEDAVTVTDWPFFGVATGPSNQWVWSGAADDNVATTATSNYTRKGDFVALGIGSQGIANVASWLPNGFRLNWTFAAVDPCDIYYLAMKGGSYRATSLVTGINTSDVVTVTGVGFTPKSALFVSGNATENASGVSNTGMALSFGCATGAGAGLQAAVELQDKHGSATSDTFTALDYDQVYVNADWSATMVIEGLMTLTSFTADGLTCTMTDGDPSGCFVGVLCIGAGAAGSLPDEAGLIYVGAEIRYTDAFGVKGYAALDVAQASYGDTVDIAVLRPSGSTTIKVQVTAVPHVSSASSAPYWETLEGLRTQPLIVQA